VQGPRIKTNNVLDQEPTLHSMDGGVYVPVIITITLTLTMGVYDGDRETKNMSRVRLQKRGEGTRFSLNKARSALRPCYCCTSGDSSCSRDRLENGMILLYLALSWLGFSIPGIIH
jgi:hypothetical protein